MADSDNSLIVPEEVIKDKIYLLRGQKIMLDKDLAELYGINPIRLREQVKRNADRFPARFMFQLTEEEASHMVSQNAISSKKHLGGTLPYAFTEHGVLMLANILKSSRAIQPNGESSAKLNEHTHYRRLCKTQGIAFNPQGYHSETGVVRKTINSEERRHSNDILCS